MQGRRERTYKGKNEMQRKRKEMKRKQKPKENISTDSTCIHSGSAAAPFTTGCRKVGKSQRFHCHLPGSISPRCSRDLGSTSERCHKYSHYHFINKEQLLAKQFGGLKGYFLILCLFPSHGTPDNLRIEAVPEIRALDVDTAVSCRELSKIKCEYFHYSFVQYSSRH